MQVIMGPNLESIILKKQSKYRYYSKRMNYHTVLNEKLIPVTCVAVALAVFKLSSDQHGNKIIQLYCICYNNNLLF